MSSSEQTDRSGLVDKVARASYESWRSRNPSAKPFHEIVAASVANRRARELLDGLRADAKAVIAAIDEARR